MNLLMKKISLLSLGAKIAIGLGTTTLVAGVVCAITIPVAVLAKRRGVTITVNEEKMILKKLQEYIESDKVGSNVEFTHSEVKNVSTDIIQISTEHQTTNGDEIRVTNKTVQWVFELDSKGEKNGKKVTKIKTSILNGDSLPDKTTEEIMSWAEMEKDIIDFTGWIEV